MYAYAEQHQDGRHTKYKNYYIRQILHYNPSNYLRLVLQLSNYVLSFDIHYNMASRFMIYDSRFPREVFIISLVLFLRTLRSSALVVLFDVSVELILISTSSDKSLFD